MSDSIPSKDPKALESQDNDYLQKVADLSPNILFVLDLREQKILYVNKRVEDLFGYDTHYIYEKGWGILKSFLHPDDYDRRLENLERCKELSNEEEIEVEVRLRVVSDEWQWFRITDKVFERGEDGCVSKVIGTAQNIHNQKIYEEKLKEEHRRYKNAQAIGHIGSFERKLPGNLVTYSEEFYRILGLEPKQEEFGLQEFMSHVHPDDREAYLAAINHTHATGEPLNMITRVLRSDGTIRYVHRRAAILKDEKGSPLRVYGTVQDVTERIIAEEERKKLEWLVSSTEIVAGTGSYEADLQTKKIYLSNGLYGLLDEEPGNINPTLEWLDSRSHPEDVDKVKQIMQAAAINKEAYTYTRRIYRKNGEMRILEAQGNVVIDAEGNALKLIGLVQDVTERKKAEQELLQIKDEMANRAAESEDRFKSLVTASSDTVYKMSPNWDLLYNLDGKNFLTDKNKASSSWLEEYVPQEERPELMKKIQEAIRTKSIFEHEHQVYDKDGNTGWTHSRAIPILNDEGEIVEWLGAASNITARRKAEERQSFLLKLSDELRSLTDPEEMISVAMKNLGKHMEVNRAYYAEALEDGDTLLTRSGYLKDVPPLPVRIKLSDLDAGIRGPYLRGEILVLHDIVKDLEPNPKMDQARKETMIRACIGVPLVKDEKILALVGVHQSIPRQWTAEDIAIVEEVCERTWAAVQRAKVEKELKENEERLLQAMEAGNQFGWEVDLETGKVTYSGDQQAVLGFELPNSMLERFSLVHPDDFESSKEAYKRALENNTSLSLIQRLMIPKTPGKTVWTRVEGKFFGNPPKLIGTTRNINEEKKAEERQNYLLNLSDGLRTVDDPKEILYKAASILGKYLGATRVGYAEDRGDGKTVAVVRNYTNGVDGIEGIYTYEDYGADLLKELRAGETVVISDIAKDTRLSSAEKEAHAALNLAASVNVPLLKKKMLLAILFIHFDKAHYFSPEEIVLIEETADRTWAAVERSRAEQALREAQESLSIALEAAQMGTWILDLTTGRSKRNLRHDQIFGFEEPQNLWNIEIARKQVLREDHHIYDKAVETALETGILQLEVRIRWQDGSIHWMAVNGHFYFNEKGEAVRAAGVNFEVTERRLAEQALKESEQRFRNLVETSALAVWETDPFGKVVEDSPSWRNFTGQTLEEWVGTGWVDAVHPQDREATIIDWQKAVSNKKNFDYEFRLRSAEGDYRWTNVKAIPILDLDGNVTKWTGMNLDIHERKLTEEALRKAKEEAEKASRAKEDFVSTMSHEIRTPLNAIIGLTNLLMEQKPREDQKENLSSLSFSAKNLLVLINDILDFSKLEAGKMEIAENQFNLPDLLFNLQKAHQPQAKANGTEIILKLE